MSRAVRLAFSGGVVEIAPTQADLIDSAIGWQAMAQQARTRLALYSARGWEAAVKEEEAALAHAMGFVERTLAELKGAL